MSVSKNIFTVDNANAEIKIYGYIVENKDATWDQFLTDFNQVANHNSKAKIRINSGGGDMFKGLAIYDAIRNSKCEFTGIVEGVAASMAGPIFLACDIRLINKNARIMVHKPQGMYMGEADGFAGYADLMKQEEQKLVNIFVERTGQTEEVVKSWFIAGAEKWFNATDALKYGLATGIVDNVKDNKKLQNFSGSMEDIISIYNMALLPENEEKPKDHNMKKVILVLNAYKVDHTLTDESTEDQVATTVENALKAKDARIVELDNKLKAQSETTITNALDEAQNAGKFTAAERSDWKAALENNFDGGMRMLKALTPAIDVNKVLNKGGDDKAKGPDNRKDWTARDWETKDPEGWKKMRVNNTAEFDRISEAYYGTEEAK